jgi:hypothetical protein
VKFCKNIIIIALGLQLVLPSVAYEVFRFPNLIVHFLHHNTEHQNINFIEFVSCHYGHSKHKHDGNEHNNLPFQNHSCGVHFQQVVALDSACFIYSFAKYNCVVCIEKLTAFEHNLIPCNITLLVWRPPQMA